MTTDEWDGLRYFKPEEFTSPEKMSMKLLRKLELAREWSGVPMEISSSFRADSTTSHGTGEGVDIRCGSSQARYKLMEALLKAGFNRIGCYDRHLHADVAEWLPGDVIWWGTSD